MGKTSKGSGGGEEVGTNTRVHGGHGVIEMVRETGAGRDGGEGNG